MKILNYCRKKIGLIPRIESGPGKGMRFNVGPATLYFITGHYEIEVQKVLASIVKPHDVFYDVGANIGFFTVVGGRLVGSKGKVYAFEPVSKNAKIINQNIRYNHLENVEVLQMAIEEQIGKTELLLAEHPGGAVLKSAGIPPDMTGSIMVDTNTIDNLVGNNIIIPPNVVKIDVEGAEINVLKGMVDILDKTKPLLIVEVDDDSEIKCSDKMEGCRDLLKNYKYRIEEIPNSYEGANWFVRHFVGIPKTQS